MTSPQQQVLLRTYNHAAGEDMQSFNEVYNAEYVKHSSSILIDIEQNNNKEPSNSIDDKKMIKKLKQDLIQYRIAQASATARPAFAIFTNSALEGICASLPQDEESLLEVKGIGPKKLELYGDDIIGIVKKYIGGDKLDSQMSSSNIRKVSRPELVKTESLMHEHSSSYEDQKRTKEQCDILSYEPGSGEIVAVNAYAGCGKTTTVSLLPVVI